MCAWARTGHSQERGGSVSCLNSAPSGEMSEDDLEMVKMEIDQFHSIVLTLRKKVHDVKGY